MWSITERNQKSGKRVFVAQIRPAGEKSINKTFATRSEAEKFAREECERIRKKATQGQSEASRSFYKERFKDAIALYVADHERCGHHRYPLLRVDEFFDDVTLGELTPGVVQKYVDAMLKTDTRMGRKFKANTLHSHLSAMSAVYKWRALQYNIDATTSVFSTARLPANFDVKRVRRLARWEEQALFKVFRGLGERGYLWRILVKLSLETAARQQELFYATWEEFDMEARVWNLPSAHTKCKVDRAIPLSKAAHRAVRAAWALRKEGSRGPFDGLVSVINVRCSFRIWLKKAGIVGFRFHDLRHESISRIVRNKRGLAVFEIMKFVGHSSTAMLARYTNLRADELVAAMQ